MVYEDERVVCFHDARPAAPLHVLIVPRSHIPTLNDVDPDSGLLSHMGRAAVVIAEKFGVKDAGYRFFFNVNQGGGQVVFHLHAHVISKVYGGK
jgi:histidine triad (HIT) family protein